MNHWNVSIQKSIDKTEQHPVASSSLFGFSLLALLSTAGGTYALSSLDSLSAWESEEQLSVVSEELSTLSTTRLRLSFLFFTISRFLSKNALLWVLFLKMPLLSRFCSEDVERRSPLF